MTHAKKKKSGSVLSTAKKLLTAAVIGTTAGIGVPNIAQRLFRWLPWGQVSDTEKERYQRWLRAHRRKLWGRDFDDGDGSVIDHAFELANRAGDGRIVEQIVACLENEPNDKTALAKMEHIIEQTRKRFRL